MKTKGQQKVPHPLFDALIKENALKNDAELGRAIKVQPPNLSRMRGGHTPISDTVRVNVMRRFRWSLKRLDELAPPVADEAAAQ